jgi:CheY-like chemotaxis protein
MPSATPHILLVEDDEDQRAAVAGVLRAEGYAVTESASAEDALECLQMQAFDLLITDYQLGGATGSWLARIATGSMQPSSPRALLITGHDEVADAGGLTVLHKPLDMPVFLSVVAQALAFQPAAAPVPPAQRIAFVLYVTNSVASRRTLSALQSLFAGYDDAQISLTIVNVAQERTHQAEEHRIVVTPTLLKTFPAPRMWIAGEVAQPSLVGRLLEQAGVEVKK